MRVTSYEDLIIRSSYLEKMTNKNVDSKVVEYKDIIQITARLAYNNMYQTMDRIGYDLDDVTHMSKLYAYYFFNLYSDKVAQKTKNGERNALITFIKQRLWYLLRIGGNQAKNFHPHNWVGGYFAQTPNSVAIEEDMKNADPTFYGYRRVTQKEYLEAKNNRTNGRILDKFGFEIVRMGYLDIMTESEYSCILHDGMDMSRSAEERAVNSKYAEEKEEIDGMIEEFLAKDNKDQIAFLNKLIKNTTNQSKKESAKTLKRILKRKNA